MRFLLILTLVLSSSLSYAESCKRVSECVDLATKLSGKTFIYQKKLFGDQDELEQAVTMDKDNAEVVLSEVLYNFGYTKAPTDVNKTWRIFNARDVRYEGLPQLEGSKSVDGLLPLGKDYVMYTYKGVRGSYLTATARNLRPFMSRFGRVIDVNGDTIILCETSSTIKKLLPIIRAADVALPKEQRAKLELEEKKRREEDRKFHFPSPRITPDPKKS